MDLSAPSEQEPQWWEVTLVSGVDFSPPSTVPLKVSERERMPGTLSSLVSSPVVLWPSEVAGNTPETLPSRVPVSWVSLRVSE